MAKTLVLFGWVAYLLGSIPFGWILMRLFRHQDIRTQGSGNIGATNVVRSGGKVLGAGTFLLDGAKGYFAVAVAHWTALQHGLSGNATQDLLAVAALGAILGHIFPVWLRFRGGKGVATGFGVFLAISPIAALLSALVFTVSVLLSRYVSLSSILGALALPIAALLLSGGRALTPPLFAVLLLVPSIVIAKHHGNIRRLMKGTEYRFGKSKASAA